MTVVPNRISRNHYYFEKPYAKCPLGRIRRSELRLKKAGCLRRSIRPAYHGVTAKLQPFEISDHLPDLRLNYKVATRPHKKLGESGYLCYEIHGLSGPVPELVAPDSELTRALTDSAEPLSHRATASAPLITPGHSFQLPNYSRRY